MYEDPDPIEPLPLAPDAQFDLIMIAYTVWFVSPSLPTTAFMQSAEAQAAVKRQTGHHADRLPQHVADGAGAHEGARSKRSGGHLIDNVALVDLAHMAATFISTPMWMLTGKRGPFLDGKVPRAGVPAEEIARASRFGEAIARQLPQRQPAMTTRRC